MTAVVAALVVADVSACKKQNAPTHAPAEPLRVAAAADLTDAFGELGAAFEKSAGTKVTFSFGSTGQLTKQIIEGAPFEVLAAANVSYVDDAVGRGSCLSDTKKTYARGHLVVWSSDRTKLPSTFEALRDPKYAKIAIANPDHAPYGLAAKQALTKAGLWAALSPRLVYGENVQQTMMFAKSGNAEVALVALSLALGKDAQAQGGYLEVDPALHEPLDQAMVVCNGTNAGQKHVAARAFVDFVGSPQGRTIMRRYGFLLPGETLAPSSSSSPTK